MTTGSRSKAWLGAACVAVALAVPGCGGGDEPTAAEQARTGALEFVEAIEAGEFEAACDALTRELAEQLGGEACPQQVEAVAGAGGDVAIEITSVRVSGPKAVAQTEVRRSGAGAMESSLELVEHDGSWRVSALGG